MYIAIDPGLTTGICVGIDLPSGTERFTVKQAYEVVWDNRFWFHTFFFNHRDVLKAIIIERFKLFPKRETMLAQINSEFPSVRIIGIVEAYAEMYGLLDKIVYQEPNDRKSVTIPIEHQRALPVNGKDHIKDAYRHLRFYYLTHRSN